MKYTRLTAFIILLLSSMNVFANDGTKGIMRENGRLYVVVAVVLVILLGLILYVVKLDRKISKLEKENK